MNISHQVLPLSQTIGRFFRVSTMVGLVLASQTAMAAQESEKEEEKNSLDPTKVITKLGLGYTDDLIHFRFTEP